MASPSETTPRRPWLASELNRSVVGSVFGAIGFVVLMPTGEDVSLRTLYASRAMQAFWSFWAAYSAASALTIPLAFRGLKGDALADAVLNGDDQGAAWVRRMMRHPWGRSFLVGGGTLSLSLTISLTSLMMMVLLLALEALDRMSATMTVIGIAATIGSWLYLWMIYALQYAREDLRTRCLEFPGEEREREFSDYVYAAMAGQVTFGTTDVAVTTAAMRRHVTVHGLLAFVFNTIILAVVISLLAGG
ncbi:hypothetical protein GCM10027418_31520 [Mariniluteicoccus endophyticus]